MELFVKLLVLVALFFVLFRFIAKPLIIKLLFRKIYLATQDPKIRKMLEKHDSKWLSQNDVESSR